MANASSPWVGLDGHWPLPWLEGPWRQAVAQRGHALLLHGPEHVGQFELALALVQTWLCEGHAGASAVPACGRCDACHQLRAGVHPDALVLVPESLRERLGLSAGDGDEGRGAGEEGGSPAGKTKAGGREIRVADVRRAIDWAHQTSSRGRGKVLVLHPVQALNPIAANALLKTLEEPAGRLRLILSGGDAQALLPTLRSRCQRVALPLPAFDLALQWLQSQGLVEGAEFLLRAAGGRPQEALAMAGDGLDARLWPELPVLLRQGRTEALQGLPVARVVDTLQKLCLDLMAKSHGAPTSYFPPEALPAGARPQALSRWWARLQRTARHEGHAWNAALLLESLMLEGRQCWPAKAADARTRN